MNRHSLFRLGVLGSGHGSNLTAIAHACAGGKIPAEIAVVISDVENAGILQRAAEHHLPVEWIAPGKFRAKLDDDAEKKLIETLENAEVDLVVLAGFMRILKGEFLCVFENRVVNIHPSLLPAFPGLEAWKQALEYGVKFTGCTVHFVDPGIDTGPIIAQQTIPILFGDTAEKLRARIQEAEWKLYSEVIGGLARGEISVQGRQTIWKK